MSDEIIRGKQWRETKKPKNVRLTFLAINRLADLVEGSGRSEAVLIDDAIIEYFRRHPEFWPDRLFPGWSAEPDSVTTKEGKA